MTDIAIRVDSVSKRYRLGEREPYKSVRDVIARAATAPVRRLQKGQQPAGNGPDYLWALKDVSFEVKHGEVLGIIGRNGAGKSTLLKILSRITKPTKGQAELYGRVGSLLEVGTGFHPELTGRENVYLNGAILGMKRAEIEHKFDEIVAFAEMEKFLDTPVKRYSSGMYVRLAFAVAAHLEPEILLVDEVLAVGDAAFQKKCLGKMDQIAREGRTILFVSHNMDAILNLCGQVVVMDSGRNSNALSPEAGVRSYLKDIMVDGSVADLRHRSRSEQATGVPIMSRLVIKGDGGSDNVLRTGGSLTLLIDLENCQHLSDMEVGVIVTNEARQRVVVWHSRYHAGLAIKGSEHVCVSCHVPYLPLLPGTYYLDLAIAAQRQIAERIESAAQFHVIFADVFGTGLLPNSRQGHLALPSDWSIIGE